jgi:hypothetical protein
MKGASASIEAVLPALDDVRAASKVQAIDWVRDDALGPNVFSVLEIEYGPDAKAGA